MWAYRYEEDISRHTQDDVTNLPRRHVGFLLHGDLDCPHH